MSDREQKNETVDDVLAKMVRESIIHVSIPATDLEIYVNRIKAACKRERAKVEADALSVGGIVEAARTAEKSSAVGNAAAMREALKFASVVLTKWRQDSPFSAWNEYDEAIDRCLTALSAPPRNCDVGTAEEQFKRYLAFCHSESRGCEHCPANRTRLRGTSNCDLAWAQMLYEAQEGVAK